MSQEKVPEKKVSQDTAAVSREKGCAKARGWRKCGSPEARVAAGKQRGRAGTGEEGRAGGGDLLRGPLLPGMESSDGLFSCLGPVALSCQLASPPALRGAL